MPLPPQLRAKIDRELNALDRPLVARAAGQITTDYKQGRFSGSLRSPESRIAYLTTRLPATFAANQHALAEIKRVLPDFHPVSMLDLGAGPGTAMWAAREAFPSLAQFTLLDSNPDLLHLGQRLSTDISGTRWMVGNIVDATFPVADLVVLSYALGEVNDPAGVVDKAWNAASQVLLVIEPGTPRNFSTIASIREQVITSGGHPIAPCPHTKACPMAVAGDWCHFAVRLERTAEHRRLKNASLGYEDEKFSYLAFGKQPATPPQARIVRHPAVHGGHIQLTLCTGSGIQSSTVTRSNKPAFRAARKTAWGNHWPFQD